MKVTEAGVTLLGDASGNDKLTRIERAGRICYKSEDKIQDGSAEKFVSALIKRGHESVLEHASFIFKTNARTYTLLKYFIDSMNDKGYKNHIRMTFTDLAIISGNVRAFRDLFKAFIEYYTSIPRCFLEVIKNNPVLFSEFRHCTKPDWTEGTLTPLSVNDLSSIESEIHRDLSVMFICDRGVSHEIVRHRIASFSQESTRYCNYIQDKFGGEITVIIPPQIEDAEGYKAWAESCLEAEYAYFNLLDLGYSPQIARSVLPTCLKTELIMTANVREWRHFLKLRTAEAAHPQMRELACMLQKELAEKLPVIFGGKE